MYVSRGSVGMYPSLRPPPRSGVSRDGLCWGVTPVSICLALPGESLVGAFLSFNESLWFNHWRLGQTPVLRHTLHFDRVQCWFSLIAPFRLKVSIELMHLCLVFCDYGWLSPKVYVELITMSRRHSRTSAPKGAHAQARVCAASDPLDLMRGRLGSS